MRLADDMATRILPVAAEENLGINKIPIAFADVLAERLGLQAEMKIVQREKISRTNSKADHRLAFTPTFTGAVAKANFFIVDDTLTMGGTIASLRGYIENRGGHVLGAAVMTAHPGALDIKVKALTIEKIRNKHGNEMNEYWKEEFGYGIELTTEGEAGHIRAAATTESLRARILEARSAGIFDFDKKSHSTEKN
jgi:hypoxanthine-guanine phosphoribosyltransferase